MFIMAEMDLGLKRPDTILLAILEKMLMLIGDLDIVPRTTTVPPITQVTMVDSCFISGSSCFVDNSIHDNEIGDIRGDDEICRSRPQEIIHSSF